MSRRLFPGPWLGLVLVLFLGAIRLAAQVIPPGIYTTVINGDSITSGIVYVDPGASFSSPTLAISNNAGIYWRQVGNLNGMAITQGNGSYIYVSGVNHTLALGSGTTVTGNVRIYSDGSAGTAIDNQGTLTNTTGTGQLYAINMTNSGSVTATAGSFYFGNNSSSYSSTNTGTVTSDGSGTTVYVRGSVDNNGTITAQNGGILAWDGNTTTANLGTVVLTSGGTARLEGLIDNTAANLAAPTGGSWQLAGGNIVGGTIDGNALTFTSSGGYLSGATLNGDLSLSGYGTYVRFMSGANFAGANADLAANTGIYWQQTATLVGKTITQGTNSYIYLAGAGTGLTLDAATTVTGNVRLYTDGSANTTIINQGTLTNNAGGAGQVYATSFMNEGAITAADTYFYLGSSTAGYNSTNTGTITADGSGGYAYLRGNFDNNGTVTAQNNGTLYWEGNNTTANLGSVVLTSGGRALLNGTIDNTAANLTAPTGGSFQLYGGTITGGTIDSNALAFTSSGGYLNGATLTGDFDTASGSYVRFINGATFTGANASLGNNSGIYWQQTGTLAGKTITQGSSSYLYLTGAGASLTLDAATSVTGNVRIYTDGSTSTTILNQGTLTNTVSNGQVYATSFTNEGAITAASGNLYLGSNSPGYNTTNTGTGTVTADGASTTVYLRGNFDNNGTITAQNSGTLWWDGTTTTANLGNVVLTGGGRALLNGTIDNASANLAAPTGGTYQLYGGTIAGGTIDPAALSFTSSGGYLDNTSWTGDFNMAATGTYVRFLNGTMFTGANANLANGSGVYWQQVGTLAGKAITLGTSSYFYLSGTGTSLTLDAATTVTGNVRLYTDGSANTTIVNQGTLTNTTGTGQIYATTFNNAGAISATAGTTYLGSTNAGYNTTNTGTVTSDGASTTIYLRGNFDNNGTVTAQNSGTLWWDGNTTTANLGNVVLTGGGRAMLNGTVDNTAANLAAPTGGSFQLLGGSIVGGTIDNNALTFTGSGGYLNGATLTGDLTLGTSSTYVRFLNGATFTGANLSLAGSSGIYWQQAGTLAGKTITQAAGSYIYLVGINNNLTLDAATTATGTIAMYSDGSSNTAITNLGTLTHTGGSGSNYASNYTNAGTITATGGTLYLGSTSSGYNTTNTGTVTADGSGTTIYLQGNLDNDGTMTAQNNGVLLWNGTNTTGNLGNVVLTGGGRALLNGTINNAGTINAPTGGTFELYGGTIAGGTIAANALSFTTSGGYLDGATLADDLNVGTASSYVRFINGAMFTGANASFANNASLYWQQSGTLAGKTITMAPSSYIYVAGANRSLTLDAATTVTGTVSIYSDGNAGTTINNQGTLNHTGGTGSNYAINYTNAGAINATGGTLYLGSTSSGYNTTNTGTVTADGASTAVYLQGNFDNNGTVTAQNGGTLQWTGNNTAANIGSVVVNTGGHARFNGTLDLTGYMLNAPAGGGTFELAGGTIQGGTVNAGALTFTNSGGYLNGVILSDDLNLSSPGSFVRFTGGTTILSNTLSFATNSSLYWQQVGTLANKLISMSPGSYIYVNGAGNSLTLDPGTTVSGVVEIFTDSSSGVAITNQGTITHVAGSGYVDGKTFTNSGTVNIAAGSFYLGDSSSYNTINTASGLIQQTGGTVYIYAPLTNSGTLKVTGGTMYTNGYITNTATGRIGGSGTLSGDLNLGAGTIAPGNSIGTLTINASDFVVSGPSIFEVELDATSSDRLTFVNPTSNVDIGAGLLTLSLNLLSAPGPGTTYTLMNISSGSYAITGYFAGLPNNGDALIANFAGTDYTFNVGYMGNAILLTVPEPSTYALLGAGLALLALRRCRRAK